MNDFLQWPEELNKVIVVHQTLEYDEYYRTLLSMDLLLPGRALLSPFVSLGRISSGLS